MKALGIILLVMAVVAVILFIVLVVTAIRIIRGIWSRGQARARRNRQVLYGELEKETSKWFDFISRQVAESLDEELTSEEHRSKYGW